MNAEVVKHEYPCGEIVLAKRVRPVDMLDARERPLAVPPCPHGASCAYGKRESA
jgi:hypothetical protein